MYNPGRNRTKIKIYDHKEKELVQMPTGEYTQKKKLKCIEWAEVLSTTGRDFLEFKKIETDVSYRLRIRRREDINVHDLVEFNGTEMEISFVSFPINNYVELVVTCQI